MDHAVTDDYFSFMSNKSHKTGILEPRDPPVAVQPLKVQPSHMEVIESDLSDTVIERIFRRPAP